MAILPYPKFKATNGLGVPYAGGKVYTYRAGSTTNKSAYSNRACTIAHANPIILDSNGEMEIYLLGSYKIVLKDSANVTIWTIDNLTGMDIITGEGEVFPDSSEVDHGKTGSGNTIKALLDAAGSKPVTITLRNNSGSSTTDYNIKTPMNVPSTATLKFEDGARLVEPVSASATIVIAGKIDSGPNQIFSGFEAGDIVFQAVSTGGVNHRQIYYQWWGSDDSATASIPADGGYILHLTTGITLGSVSQLTDPHSPTIIPRGDGHITILPWHYSSVTQGNWVAVGRVNDIMGGYFYNLSDAQNDRINYKLYLKPGTYTFNMLGATHPNKAIVTVLIDDVSVGTMDWYTVAEALNAQLEIVGIVIAAEGLKTLSLKAATRNASATNWFIAIQSMAIWRTA